ncbi:MAG: tail fiber domain-containing protein [bacterium]|nr:tail fiber domain-containing protein [bacterium]
MKSVTMHLLAILISASFALAVPPYISYQGYLTSPEGTPLDTTVAMTFKFYGNFWELLWEENHPEVTVTDGYFNVTLGNDVFLTDSVLASGIALLQVTVGSDSPMTPETYSQSVPYAFRTGTVDGATGGTLIGSLSSGSSNSIPPDDCFAAGSGQVITQGPGTIAGGSSNTLNGVFGLIGGGVDNVMNSAGGVCGGGYGNEISSTGAAHTIVGGYHNDITGPRSYGVISGGAENLVTGSTAAIGGGSFNRAHGDYSAICGGGGPDAADSNSVSALASTIGGGQRNEIELLANHSFIGGGDANSVTANNSIIGGGRNNRVRGAYSVVAGGGGPTEADSNSASGANAFIGAGTRGKATGDYSFVGAGYGCEAHGQESVVVGGEYCYANALRATVGGGFQNQATGQDAVVAGGNGNVASGSTSTVPGGAGNEATAFMTTAMGFRAKANHIGSFVWADRTYTDFASTADNQVSFRASGGVRIATNGAGTVGVKLDNGDTAWEVLSDSTKKTNRTAVNTATILDKLTQLPVEEWNYSHQDAANTHIGPMAQNFHALFGYGDDNTTISTIDPDGVALAAIQELAKQNREMQNEITNLRSQIQSLMAGQAKASMEINHEISK